MCFKGQYCGQSLANMMFYADNACHRVANGVSGKCVTFEGQKTNNAGCSIYEECCRATGCNIYDEISADEC